MMGLGPGQPFPNESGGFSLLWADDRKLPHGPPASNNLCPHRTLNNVISTSQSTTNQAQVKRMEQIGTGAGTRAKTYC